MKKILIITPIYSYKKYVLKEFFTAVNNLTINSNLQVDMLFIDNTDDIGEFSIFLIELLDKMRFKIPYRLIRFESNYQMNSREKVGYSFILARNYFLGHNYDKALFLEADVIAPKNTILLLDQDDKPIVSGVVTAPGFENGCAKTIDLWGGGKVSRREHYTDQEYKRLCKNNIFPVGQVTFGCLLLDKKILKKVDIEWNMNHLQHPDIFFSYRCRLLGLKVWLDIRVKCVHKWKEWRKERGGVINL